MTREEFAWSKPFNSKNKETKRLGGNDHGARFGMKRLVTIAYIQTSGVQAILLH